MNILFLFSFKKLLGRIVSNSFAILREERFQTLPRVFVTVAFTIWLERVWSQVSKTKEWFPNFKTIGFNSVN